MPLASQTPDFVLEAHFKTLLRKARLFDLLETRLDYAEIKNADGAVEVFDAVDEISLYDFANALLAQDPAFQWLKD